MHIFKVENSVVTQCWKAGDTLKQIKAKYKDADIRQGTAECTQIETAPDVFADPPPTPKTTKELKREAIRDALDDDDFKDIILALAKANPGVIPDAIKTKVQEALQA